MGDSPCIQSGGWKMSEHKKEPVSIQEIAISNMYSIEALVRVLVRKGLVTQDEILSEINILRTEQIRKKRI